MSRNPIGLDLGINGKCEMGTQRDLVRSCEAYMYRRDYLMLARACSCSKERGITYIVLQQASNTFMMVGWLAYLLARF